MKVRFSWIVRSLLLAAAVPACDSTAPDLEPRERFGQIQALVRGRLWIGEFEPDSIIGRYNPLTGRVDLYAARPDRYGRSQSLSIRLCTVPGQDSYRFAALTRGPFGLDALARGAYGEWHEPIRPQPNSDDIITHWTLISAGGTEDVIVFEALMPWYARGWFRFSAASYEGEGSAVVEGRFFGRVERSSGSCPEG